MNAKKAKQLRQISREFAKSNGQVVEAIDKAIEYTKENPLEDGSVLTAEAARQVMLKIIYKQSKKAYKKAQKKGPPKNEQYKHAYSETEQN